MLILKLGDAYTGNACRSLYISEATGAYSASNLGGWGNGTDIADVDETHLIITFPDGTTVVDIEDPTGIPTVTTTFEYEVTAAVLGGTTIADGLYQIEYTVLIGATTYTTGKRYYIFTCNLDCCVSNMFANIAQLEDCNCNSNVISNARYAASLLRGLKALKNCGTVTGITSLFTKLNTICNLSDSDCGCNG
jgi:hypothetical protein